MVNMENAEEVMQILDRFTRLKQKEIPKELDEYLQYVAKTGDTVFKWSSLKYLFREKLLNVIKHFHDTTPRVDEIPQYPNVDPFNYESMKTSLLERLEVFNAAPFTIQRLCELLIDPRKQYSRIDKFMRALEKNILVVSTIEPGRKRTESENGDSLDSVVNGDLSLDVNVDIDMENDSLFNMETQNGNGTSASDSAIVETQTELAAAATTIIGNVKDKPVTETPNVSHTADDDILPNPKKAKLDIDLAAEEETLVKTTAVEKAEITVELTANEGAITEKKDDAGKITDIKRVENTASADVDMQETNENKDNQIETEKESLTSEDQVTGLRCDKVETLDKEVTKEDEQSNENKAKENIKNNEEVIKSEQVAEQKESETDLTQKVETVKETSDTPAVKAGGKEEKSEKIIEKQEIEAGEKEKTAETKINQDNINKELRDEESTAEATGVDKNEKVEIEKSLTEDVLNDKIEEKESVNENNDKTDTSENTVTTTSEPLEATVKQKTTAGAESKTVDTADNIPKAILAECVDKKDVAELTEHLTENSSSAKNIDKEESRSQPIEISTVTVKEQVDVEKTEEKPTSDKESIKPATADIAEKNSSDDSTDPSLSTEKTPIDSVDEKVFAVSDVEKSSTSIAEKETPEITAEETITAKDVSETKKQATESIAPVTTPTLALNDQPMEENTVDVPLDDISVTDEVPPPAVEEVVMAEASSGGTSEMATDIIEPAKDEPAGMEVDDTSQEAMDQ